MIKDNDTLDSEKVILESPMSFTGATKRIWPEMMDKNVNKYVKWLLLFPMTLFVLYIVYAVIFTWYMIFGLLLLPFRLMMRSSRNKKKQEMQHRELLQSLKSS